MRKFTLLLILFLIVTSGFSQDKRPDSNFLRNIGLYLGYSEYFNPDSERRVNGLNKVTHPAFRIEPRVDIGKLGFVSVIYGRSEVNYILYGDLGPDDKSKAFYHYLGCSMNIRLFPLGKMDFLEEGMIYAKGAYGRQLHDTMNEKTFPRNEWTNSYSGGFGANYHFKDFVGIYSEYTWGSFSDFRIGLSFDF